MNLPDANITSVLWATGYKLDFRYIDVPVLDEWGYPKHTGGVMGTPGLFVIGLPWLTKHYSSIVAGVGLDAEHVANTVKSRNGPLT